MKEETIHPAVSVLINQELTTKMGLLLAYIRTYLNEEHHKDLISLCRKWLEDLLNDYEIELPKENDTFIKQVLGPLLSEWEKKLTASKT